MPFTISPAGFKLVQHFEGFRAAPMALADGDWLVGYGHLRAEAGEAIGEAEAAALLALDLAPFERLVSAAVTQKLAQSQFDALASFAFSIGEAPFVRSEALRKVNAGDFIAAACALDAWRKREIDGEVQVSAALVARRAAEKALLLKDVAHAPAPSALARAQLDHAAAILGATLGQAPAPATETLLLTQVEAGDARDTYVARAAPRDKFYAVVEHGGLLALFAFGIGLVSIGTTMLLCSAGDFVDAVAGAAITGPGLAAVLLAGFGYWRGPKLAPMKALT